MAYYEASIRYFIERVVIFPEFDSIKKLEDFKTACMWLNISNQDVRKFGKLTSKKAYADAIRASKIK